MSILAQAHGGGGSSGGGTVTSVALSLPDFFTNIRLPILPYPTYCFWGSQTD